MCHPERSAAESKDLHFLELATLPNWSNTVANFRLTTLAEAAMKILYASPISPHDSSLYRGWALERLGHTLTYFDPLAYMPANRFIRAAVNQLIVGPGVNRLNRDILDLAESTRPDLFWADKLLWIQPQTINHLRGLGIATVSYMIDNPFGTRNDRVWRVYLKGIPHYDLHVVQRDANIPQYLSRGARDVIKIQTACEPTLHFPPPAFWSDHDRDRGVSFIGTPYDDRAQILTRLANLKEFPVVISGSRRLWQRDLDPATFESCFREGELYLQQYREGIWRSRINLSFLTHSNQDEFVHKSFEIAGCGGFLLAERSPGHMQRFEEDQEAVFFTGFDELAEKIRRYYPDEAARTRIAAAGAARGRRDGYHNDHQVRLILERASKIMQDSRNTVAHAAAAAKS
jgi:spore maturation protein CgeB